LLSISLALLALVVTCVPRAQAQCGATWNTTIGTPGANGSVQALTILANGDVIVGGNFTSIGGIAANRVARYNPTTRVWSALGDGVNSSVLAITEVPAGMTGAGDIIVGGFFTTAGSVTTTAIARFRPSTGVWSNLGGAGMTGGVNNTRVETLVIVPSGVTGAGELIVGGFFNTVNGIAISNVGRYTLATGVWSALGSGSSGFVADAAILPDGDIVAGGATALGVRRFSRVSGTWSTLGTITSLGADPIASIDVSNGQVFVSGSFSAVGGQSASNIARYTLATTTWSAVGTGLNGVATSASLDASNNLVLNGLFTSAGTVAAANGIVRYNPATGVWSNIGTSSVPAGSAIAPLAGGDLILGGSFSTVSGFSASNIARFSLDAGATITSQPTAQNVCPGSTVNFSVTATAIGTISYQWRKNGVNIDPALNPSAATNTLTLTNVQQADATSYSCQVTTICSVTSSSAALTLRLTPAINVQPAAQVFACPGGGATFTTSAIAGAAPYTYRWRRNGTPLNTALIPSAATATLTLSNVQAGDLGTYTCEITNACASIITNDSVLSFGSTGNITQQPVAQSRCVGQTATFSITTTGATLYRWYRNGQQINITTNPSAATPTLTLTNVQAGDAGSYFAEAAGACGGSFSNSVQLAVNAPAITQQPTSTSACVGTTTTFTVAATGASALSYQWRLGTTPINTVTNPSAATPSLTLTNINSASGGSYNCVITQTCGTVTSNNAVLNVLTPLTFTTLPASTVALCTNGLVDLEVNTTGSNPVTFRWRKNGTDINAALNPTAATRVLRLTGVTSADNGTYECIATGPCGSIMSPATTVTVASPVTISSQPQPINACEGGTASFSVTTTGGPVATYRWRKGTTPIDIVANPSAATATLTLNNVTIADQGFYSCVITNACSQQPTNTAPLTILSGSSPACQPACDSIDFNGNGVFPEDQDVLDYVDVLAGGECPTGTCNDIDFNNNGVFPEDQDLTDFFTVLAGGNCV
jgi:hypothetical protein